MLEASQPLHLHCSCHLQHRQSVHHFLMPSKTISLEIDAYDRLKATRRVGESFSAVIRRITLPRAKATAAELLKEVKAGTFGRGADWVAIERAALGRRSSRELRRA
jgi:predicted CopG family antitoxin